MVTTEPKADTPWAPLPVRSVAELLAPAPVRWWLSGGVALDHWLGEQIQERPNIDVSIAFDDLEQLLGVLPEPYSAWSLATSTPIPWREASPDVDPHPILIHDSKQDAWVLQVNLEDGTDKVWLYKRDARMHLPWERAVLDVAGIPTGAPEVQLLWKTLRPRPQDDTDKDAVLPHLSEEAEQWWEHAILSIHPHSSWSIHVRSPMYPAKASWNRTRRNQNREE